MATTTSPPKIGGFPGPLGTKRRRMRSGGNVSTMSNNSPKSAGMDEDDPKPPSAKCKATSIPIFLKKTYKMIDTCDGSIASWTADGEMFVVKDPDRFASEVIPQYFDHNKFSSFARQLNFYGFRKMQSKPIRNSDFDEGTAKHVTFFNENFKRGRCDLLKNIQRSTRGGGANNGSDQSREVQNLKDKVYSLEQQIADIKEETEDRMRRLELDMLARMEQMMLAMQQQQQTQLQLQTAASVGTQNSNGNSSSSTNQGNNLSNPWDNAMAGALRGTSVSSLAGNSVSFQQPMQQYKPQLSVTSVGGPTLPPHPKQKQLPVSILPPGAGAMQTQRLNSLRGISNLSRGLSNLSRGASIESTASAALMRNTWEDKFFSMLMLGGENGDQSVGTLNMDPSMMAPTPLGPGVSMSTGLMSNGAPVTVSDRSIAQREQDEMSAVGNGVSRRSPRKSSGRSTADSSNRS